MASTKSRLLRGRGGRLTNLNPVFQRQTVQIETSQLTPFMVKQARKSGKLNLSNKNLTTVPDRVWQLDSLDEVELRLLDLRLDQSVSERGEENTKWWDYAPLSSLDLSHNSIATLPSHVKYLAALTTLNLQRNSLVTLPNEIGQLVKLTHLHLGYNKLQDVPSGVFKLTELTHLNVSHNQITNISENIGDLIMLEKLEIEPDLVEDMANLRVLGMRDNRIEEIPEELANLRNLIRVDLANNGIKDVPASLSLLPHLNSLQLEGNPLRSLRSDVVRSGTTRILRVLRGKLREGESNLSSLSPSGGGALGDPPPIWPNMYSMRSSKILSLGMKDLSIVPEEVFKEAVEAEVTCVDLCKNTLTAVPPGVFLLSQFLSELSISNNRLTEIPGDLGTCRHLQYLDVSKNSLTDLPADLENMERLREVNIAQNRLTCVPSCLYGQPAVWRSSSLGTTRSLRLTTRAWPASRD